MCTAGFCCPKDARNFDLWSHWGRKIIHKIDDAATSTAAESNLKHVTATAGIIIIVLTMTVVITLTNKLHTTMFWMNLLIHIVCFLSSSISSLSYLNVSSADCKEIHKWAEAGCGCSGDSLPEVATLMASAQNTDTSIKEAAKT